MDPVVVGILRASLAFVFAQAAVHKLRDRAAFDQIVRAHRLVPAAGARAVTGLLVAGELAAATALLAPGVARLGAGLALALLGVYSLAIGVNLARGRRDIDCGCLGPGHRQPLTGWLLVRNALLAALVAPCLLPTTSRSVTWIDLVSLLGGALVLSLVLAAATRLALLQSRTSAARRSS
jgi:hypothetical protein